MVEQKWVVGKEQKLTPTTVKQKRYEEYVAECTAHNINPLPFQQWDHNITELSLYQDEDNLKSCK